MKKEVVQALFRAFEIYSNNEADSKGLIKGLLEE